MAGLLARCTNPLCNFAFEDNQHVIGDGGTLTFSGGTTDCPRCGSRAKYGGGSFYVKDNRLEIISAPMFTRDIQNQLRGVLREVQAGKLTPDQAIEIANGLDPKVGQILAQLWNVGLGLAQFITLFLAILAAYNYSSDSNDTSEFQEKVLQELHRQTEILDNTKTQNTNSSANKQSKSIVSRRKSRAEVKKRRKSRQRHTRQHKKVR